MKTRQHKISVKRYNNSTKNYLEIHNQQEALTIQTQSIDLQYK